jgi:hypothetical protein
LKHEIDYNGLFSIDQDLQRVIASQPGLYLLLYAKIQLFYQQAANHIEKMKSGYKKIQLKYINADAKGNPAVIDTPSGRQFDYKATVTDFKSAAILTGPAIIKAYQDEMNAWGAQFKITINF